MKVGVIGTGKMGENHVRTYLSLYKHCQLVGIYDNNKEKSQQISDKYQVQQFQSLSDLLQAVDAVSVAVPTEFHYDIGLTCIKHNVHILMEKPITNTITQAKELNKKALEAGVKLQVGHIELFNPLIKILTKEVENREIIGLEFHRMSSYDTRLINVDVVKDLMIHDLYILQTLLKENVLQFHALGKVIQNKPKHAVVMIESPKGVIAQLTASFQSKKKIRTIQILTKDAFIEADILTNHISITRDTDIQTIDINNDLQPLTVELLDFINCIRTDREPFVTGEDGINALLTTNQISNTIHKNQNLPCS